MTAQLKSICVTLQPRTILSVLGNFYLDNSIMHVYMYINMYYMMELSSCITCFFEVSKEGAI